MRDLQWLLLVGRAAAERKGSRPPLRRGQPIDAYTQAQLVGLVRWIESDELLRTHDELVSDAQARVPEARQQNRGRGRSGNSPSAALADIRGSNLANTCPDRADPGSDMRFPRYFWKRANAFNAYLDTPMGATRTPQPTRKRRSAPGRRRASVSPTASVPPRARVESARGPALEARTALDELSGRRDQILRATRGVAHGMDIRADGRDAWPVVSTRAPTPRGSRAQIWGRPGAARCPRPAPAGSPRQRVSTFVDDVRAVALHE